MPFTSLLTFETCRIKPEEYYVKTRKCEPDASAKVVKICERLRDENGHIMEHTEPICCPCGPQRRMPSSCGNVFDKWMKGKPNTAHCVRFPVIGSMCSVLDRDHWDSVSRSRVNLIGDFVGYTNIPSFEDFYLVIPRQGGPGQPQSLGGNFSMWMLLERLRFTLDGMECNKIGVGFEAFNEQPNFCSSPFWTCLHNQLWNFWENAGTHSSSIGVTEVLNANLLIELSADDVEYVYQRSPGKILSISISTFEALSQVGVATIKTKNTGEVEASYGLTFDCTRDVTLMEEQFFIMKPKEEIIRSFKIYPATDQAANYVCVAILKDSDYNEVDRAECQFATTSTILDNGTQGTPFHPPKGISGFFETIASIWNDVWKGLADFITGNSCRRKCYGFFDFKCHIQYVCMSWIVMFGLFLAIFPTVIVLLWLLHQKGLFDPIYDWWEDHCWTDGESIQHTRRRETHIHHHHHIHGDKRNQKHGMRQHHHKSGDHHKRKSIHIDHRHNHSEREADYNYYLHHVNKVKHKKGHARNTRVTQHLIDNVAQHKQKKERVTDRGH
ncbi:hypothetical protein TIFTF001_003601 [Ficus carica]|uniref:Generative cell specific-1/HAP2 domain-containing protein n=1 Tax=Ficus carica TaxID=3494 RepID=A0AA87Z9U1_FICCA|nr:hypothetical protein TIFTF001_003601 [Ficus carica]